MFREQLHMFRTSVRGSYPRSEVGLTHELAALHWRFKHEGAPNFAPPRR